MTICSAGHMAARYTASMGSDRGSEQGPGSIMKDKGSPFPCTDYPSYKGSKDLFTITQILPVLFLAGCFKTS